MVLSMFTDISFLVSTKNCLETSKDFIKASTTHCPGEAFLSMNITLSSDEVINFLEYVLLEFRDSYIIELTSKEILEFDWS